jgi:hypothetical protein
MKTVATKEAVRFIFLINGDGLLTSYTVSSNESGKDGDDSYSVHSLCATGVENDEPKVWFIDVIKGRCVY